MKYTKDVKELGDYAYVRLPPPSEFRRYYFETKRQADIEAGKLGSNARVEYDDDRQKWFTKVLTESELRDEQVLYLRQRAKEARTLAHKWENSRMESCRNYSQRSFEVARKLDEEADKMERGR